MTARQSKVDRRESGAAVIEFVLILPAVMLLVAGIVEFGRLFQVYTATDRLAAAYAYSWAYCPDSSPPPTGTCGAELASYTTPAAISNVVPQLTMANLSLTMAEFTVVNAGAGAAVPVLGYSGGYQSQSTDLIAAAAAAASYTAATAKPFTTQYVVVAITHYTHSLSFFSYYMTPFLGNYLTPTYTVAQLKNN